MYPRLEKVNKNINFILGLPESRGKKKKKERIMEWRLNRKTMLIYYSECKSLIIKIKSR